ncbi:TIGR02594 family protein [Novosphingobium umbonatum]|uniref:TIGR02594 family protein n=1 Tax=Novosphingobium umbonatum TaxID=1908524 RepID=A0A3S2VTI7_9SPHN|nr:TIGR02594 family protein [Novosphingobium umbonatum]RVU05387.1 TIGR02594 family protein [Novosphingobium umbonatum]
MNIFEIQESLARLGYNPGPIDGIWGRETIRAVCEFQEYEGLAVDGVAGPQTQQALVAALGGGDFDDGYPLVWLEEAKRYIGLTEYPGPRDNPTIIDFARDLDIHYDSDETPWCGLFVAHCIGSTLPDEVLPAGPLRARNWARFGQSTQPTRGAIMVFERNDPAANARGEGHVAFYIGEDATGYYVLGGNQNNSVCFAWKAKSQLIAARWPRSFPQTLAGPVHLTRQSTLKLREA